MIIRFKKIFITTFLSIILITSCGVVSSKIPCFIKGRWIGYDSDNISPVVYYDFDNRGNYKITRVNDNTQSSGQYTYYYSSFNYTNPTGIIKLIDNTNEEKEFFFELKMNSEYGQVSLYLSNKAVREIYNLEYSGVEDI